MKMIAWLMLAAAIVPFLSAILAKAGGQKFDNNDPRPWLARQEGWRARANAAQSNAFEALPFFYAAVLFALHNQADATRVATLMGVNPNAIITLTFAIGGVFAALALVCQTRILLSKFSAKQLLSLPQRKKPN